MQFTVPLNIEHNKQGNVKANLHKIRPANKVQNQSGSFP